jgi:hypothetical protein
MSEPRSKALIGDAMRALQGGDATRAFALLNEAAAADPKDPDIPLNRALVLRSRGDLNGALQAVEQALAIDPYSFIALASQATIFEQMGKPRVAAKIFRNALKIAPPETATPPHLKPVIAHAREAVARYTDDLNRFLREQTQSVRSRHAGADLARFDECLDIFSGAKKAYVQEPLFLTFPKLPPLTFYPREHFPWMTALEAETETIRNELIAQLKVYWSRFSPYMQLPASAPLNQWAPLNNSPDWSTLHLWRDSKRNDDVCALFPKTAEILSRVPMADQPGYAPTAMFSVLAPKTAIPPHTGSSNTRLIAHLPLIIPEGCRFRVGNDVRPWVMGESFVFDDTIEHEAWNDSDELRAVLIFDVWNPFLTAAERDLVCAMTTAVNAYDAAG